jgi:hypothetical protein
MMSIKKIVFAALIAPLALTAAGAQAKEAESFKQDGVTYTYRVIERGDKRVITGTMSTFGQSRPFKLVLKNGQVRGDVNGSRVAFLTNDARASNVQLASD